MECSSCWIMEELLGIHIIVNTGFCGNCRTAKGPLKKRKDAEKKDEWKGGNNREHMFWASSAPVELKIGIRTLAQGLHLKGHTWLSVLYGTLLVQDKAFWEQYYDLKKHPPHLNGGISRVAKSLATEVLLGLQRNLSGLPSKALVRLQYVQNSATMVHQSLTAHQPNLHPPLLAPGHVLQPSHASDLLNKI